LLPGVSAGLRPGYLLLRLNFVLFHSIAVPRLVADIYADTTPFDCAQVDPDYCRMVAESSVSISVLSALVFRLASVQRFF